MNEQVATSQAEVIVKAVDDPDMRRRLAQAGRAAYEAIHGAPAPENPEYLWAMIERIRLQEIETQGRLMQVELTLRKEIDNRYAARELFLQKSKEVEAEHLKALDKISDALRRSECKHQDATALYGDTLARELAMSRKIGNLRKQVKHYQKLWEAVLAQRPAPPKKEESDRG